MGVPRASSCYIVEVDTSEGAIGRHAGEGHSFEGGTLGGKKPCGSMSESGTQFVPNSLITLGR